MKVIDFYTRKEYKADEYNYGLYDIAGGGCILYPVSVGSFYKDITFFDYDENDIPALLAKICADLKAIKILLAENNRDF